MFTGIRLSKKIPALVVGTAAVVGVGVALASYFTSAASLDKLTRQRLLAAAQTGAVEIHSYLGEIESELVLVAEQPGTVDAVRDFSRAWASLEASGKAPTSLLQETYITNNPHPTGEKDKLDFADTGTEYDEVHSKYHKWFHALQQDHGYYDIFLFDAKGNLVYSVFKELDYATNFLKGGGKWAESDLGVVYREAMGIADRKKVAFTDFAPYAPSFGAAASFMAYPIHDEAGTKVGVLGFQMPVDKINALMRNNLGLGDTGEILLVGEDGTLRNDSDFTKDVNDILKTAIPGPVLDEARQKGSAFGVGTLHRDEKLEFDAVKFDYQGIRYVLVAAQSYDAAIAPIVDVRNNMFVVALVLLAVASVAAFLAARSITKPIGHLVDAMRRLAAGDTTVDVGGAGRSDEIGDMSKAVQVFKENAIQRQQLEQNAQNERDRERQRQSFLEGLIGNFKAAISSRLTTVGDQMSRMRTAAGVLDDLAKGARSEAESAGSASRHASENVAAVAAATEEMTATVQEIANQTEATSKIVNETVEAAEATNRNVATLSEAASHIGSVVNLIRDIAAQTNLLALNATIEAARAGEAGRGFAVVASEVKDLAEQTSRATDEISGRIGGIQTSVRDAADAIEHIFEKVSDIKALTSSVAGAIEEQRAANAEIARSAKMASDSTGAAADNMQSVSGAVLQTSGEAETVNASSDLVSEASGRLAEEVEKFLEDVTRDVEDRRRAARKAIMQDVAVTTEDGRTRIVQLIDVSSKGAQLKDMTDIKAGAALTLDLSDGTRLFGTVVRKTEAGCGIEFSQALDAEHVLMAA